MGWRDWRIWDRLDRLDERVGFRRQRSRQEQADSLRRFRAIFVPLDLAFSVAQIATGAWIRGTISVVFAGCVWVMFGGMAKRLEEPS